MKKTILLIDDDKDELLVLKDALNKIPGLYHCEQASSSDEASSMLRMDRPDYILIDFNLPVINGLQLLTKLKKDRRLKDIPVFIYSTMINDQTTMEARLLGAAGCIQKQVTIAETANELNKIFISTD